MWNLRCEKRNDDVSNQIHFGRMNVFWQFWFLLYEFFLENLIWTKYLRISVWIRRVPKFWPPPLSPFWRKTRGRGQNFDELNFWIFHQDFDWITFCAWSQFVPITFLNQHCQTIFFKLMSTLLKNSFHDLYRAAPWGARLALPWSFILT